MRISIFYLSRTDKPGRQLITLPFGGTAFIRVEEVHAEDLADALGKASPAYDETVMNAHLLESTR